MLLKHDTSTFFSKYFSTIHELTYSRFGKNIQLYAPLYLSNECQNICTYCGFSFDNKLKRKTLSDEEILAEASVLKSHGFESILLVTGEDYRVNTDYILHAINLLKPYFAQISIEVQPLETADYIRLKNAGVYGVFMYQETYDKATYKLVHPKGKKANYEYRLQTPDRIGEAGIHKIGLGILLGLTEDWRADATALAEHLLQLQKKYWQTKFSISFPRIRPHEGEFQPKCHLSEKELLQLVAAFRICFPDVELTLSTRERAVFRDIAMQYGITAMSAGSKTEPGGYSNSDALKQFEIDDERSAEEMAAVIRKYGYEPVWKDWDSVLV
ncbi:MAG TPA: 2-iminoacetate synthase ThiH [Chitinophagales bacterium]|nr:2-iminoacetate synthase ThiH [Chitinophagales bacterium]